MASFASVEVSFPTARRCARRGRGTRPVATTSWVAPSTWGHSTARIFVSHEPSPPPLRRAVVSLAVARGGGRSTSPSRGRSLGRGGSGRGGRGGRDGGRRVRDDAGPGRVGWGERIARSDDGLEDDPRGSARGEEGAWRHATPQRSRAWAKSTSLLAEGEDFRVVDVREPKRVGPKRDGNDEDSLFTETKTSSGVRVNKCFKDFTSRRESDKLVEQGRVTVNGLVVAAGARVFPGDVVCLDGDRVRWETMNVFDDENAQKNIFRYVKYWKPRGVTCTTDRRDRTNIIDAVNYPCSRVFPVGRLDKDSTGFILLTNDGRVPNAVLRSGARKDKKYVVVLDTPVRESDLQTLRDGVVISTPVRRDAVDRIATARTLPCEVDYVARVSEQADSDNRRVVQIVLREGRNRQIRRMFDAVGYVVEELHRSEIMGIGLRGLSGPGEWAECDAEEMELIKEWIGTSREREHETGEEEEEE